MALRSRFEPLFGVLLMVIVTAFTLHPTQSTSAQATCNAPATSGTAEQTITSGGQSRTFRLHIPTGYDGKTPLPLVVSIHGFASSAVQQEAFSRWDDIADRENFFAVYPQGTGFPARWHAGQLAGITSDTGVDDVAFFNDLFDHLEKTLCIDPSRIFVNGLSNGGGMSYKLACDVSNRVAAIGGVAGAYPIRNECNPTRPVPVVAFHGDADPIVPFEGSTSVKVPSVKDWVAAWVKRNGCQKGPDEIYHKGDATGVAYADCQGNADVNFYTISGGGHTWPGSVATHRLAFLGKTSQDIDASETMWKFFQAHSMPAQP